MPNRWVSAIGLEVDQRAKPKQDIVLTQCGFLFSGSPGTPNGPHITNHQPIRAAALSVVDDRLIGPHYLAPDPSHEPPMESPRYLRCLGLPGLFTPGGDPVRFRTKKHLALLVYLGVEGRRFHNRDHLAELLWPGARTCGSASLARHCAVRASSASE